METGKEKRQMHIIYSNKTATSKSGQLSADCLMEYLCNGNYQKKGEEDGNYSITP